MPTIPARGLAFDRLLTLLFGLPKTSFGLPVASAMLDKSRRPGAVKSGHENRHFEEKPQRA
jgi:hypothetical protein